MTTNGTRTPLLRPIPRDSLLRPRGGAAQPVAQPLREADAPAGMPPPPPAPAPVEWQAQPDDAAAWDAPYAEGYAAFFPEDAAQSRMDDAQGQVELLDDTPDEWLDDEADAVPTEEMPVPVCVPLGGGLDLAPRRRRKGLWALAAVLVLAAAGYALWRAGLLEPLWQRLMALLPSK